MVKDFYIMDWPKYKSRRIEFISPILSHSSVTFLFNLLKLDLAVFGFNLKTIDFLIQCLAVKEELYNDDVVDYFLTGDINPIIQS